MAGMSQGILESDECKDASINVYDDSDLDDDNPTTQKTETETDCDASESVDLLLSSDANCHPSSEGTISEQHHSSLAATDFDCAEDCEDSDAMLQKSPESKCDITQDESYDVTNDDITDKKIGSTSIVSNLPTESSETNTREQDDVALDESKSNPCSFKYSTTG